MLKDQNFRKLRSFLDESISMLEGMKLHLEHQLGLSQRLRVFEGTQEELEEALKDTRIKLLSWTEIRTDLIQSQYDIKNKETTEAPELSLLPKENLELARQQTQGRNDGRPDFLISRDHP